MIRSFLVTGLAADRERFIGSAGAVFVINYIDSRLNTSRFTFWPEVGERPKDDLALADIAKACNVTLQEIARVGRGEVREVIDLGEGASCEVRDSIEEYPVLYLAPHAMKWEKR